MAESKPRILPYNIANRYGGRQIFSVASTGVPVHTVSISTKDPLVVGLGTCETVGNNFRLEECFET